MNVTMQRTQRLRQAVISGIVIVAAILVVWQSGAFRQVRLGLTDVYFTPTPTSGDVVIVALDDAALNRLGRSPSTWSREVYAESLERVGSARVVAFDLLFSESTPQDERLANALRELRQSETRTRIVLAAAGTQPTYQSASDAMAWVFTNALLPVTSLRSNADYLGFTNILPDADGTIRRQPSQVIIDGQAHYSFSMATYLAYLRIPALALEQVVRRDGDSLSLTPNRAVTTDTNGLWLQNYFGPPSTGTDNTFEVIPLLDILDGEIAPQTFEDKIVLIGLMDSRGATDRYAVPSSASGALMSGVEIQANAIEALLQNDLPVTLQRPVEAIIIFVLTMSASLAYALPRWYIKFALAITLVASWCLLAFVLFETQRLIVDLFYPSVALLVPALISIGLDVTLQTRLRQRSEFLLESTFTISEQQLSLRRVLPVIERDVKRVTNAQAGSIWLPDTDGSWQQRHHWPAGYSADTDVQSAVGKTGRDMLPHTTETHLVMPVVWHGKTNCVIVVQLRQREQTHRRKQALRDFALRLAPNVENIQLHNQVVTQRNILETVLANSPAAITLISANGDIQTYNRTFEMVFSGNSDPIQMMTMQSIVDVDPDIADQLLQKMSRHNSFRFELDVAQRAFQVDGAPIEQSNQWVIVFSDVTSLIELNRLKTRMIRMASHDLKNPLSRVAGYTQLLEMTVEPDEQTSKFLDYIQSAANEMNALISELLDLEQLQSGEAQREHINFVQLISEVYLRHEPDAVRKQQAYQQDLPASSLFVEGNHRQLSQMASNLISNAIKYTPDAGQIIVRLSQHHDTQRIRFEVQDNGLGIDKKAQEKLFTEFYRVKTEATANIMGTGLGLSLVKSVAEQHNGEVGVISEEGEGSLFYVILPMSTSVDQRNKISEGEIDE